MVYETVFYVNHKPRKRTIESLGSGYTTRDIKGFPRHTRVYVDYVVDQGRKPYYTIKQASGPMVKVDLRYVYLTTLDTDGWEYLNNKIKAERRI